MALPQLPPRGFTTNEWNSIHGAGEFPNLNRNQAAVLGPSTPIYNCIAWSIGVTNNRYNPSDEFLTRDEMIDWYENRGYEECSAAEAQVNGGVDGWTLNGVPTHASRFYNENGTNLGWTSKIGNNVLIQHDRDALQGPLYGSIVVHFRPVTTPSTSTSSMVHVDVEGAAEAQSEINRQSRELSSSFPGIAQRFRDLWGKFYQTWVHGNSSEDAFYTNGKDWDELVKLGPSILPFVAEKALDPEARIASQLYEVLQSDPAARLTAQDKKSYVGAKQQSQRNAVLYAKQLRAFNKHVEEWQAQQAAKSNSSFDDDFTHRCSAFSNLVGMGKPIIPAIMVSYAKDQTGWSHELLHVIVNGSRSPPGPVNKESLYKDWESWFEKGDMKQPTPKRGSAAPAAA